MVDTSEYFNNALTIVLKAGKVRFFELKTILINK